MNIKTLFMKAALASLTFGAFPTEVAAQRPYVWVMPEAEEERFAGESPFAVLLDRRDELELVSLQVSRIEAVRAALLTANEPLLAQLRDAELFEPATNEEREAVQHARDVIDANVREADRQVREDVLTIPQRQKARELIGHFAWAVPPEQLDEKGSTPEAPSREATPPTVLTVENHNYYDANVYLVSGSRRHRLGFVGGLNTVTLEIPESFLISADAIRFEVRQIPSFTLPLTDMVTVFPGGQVFLRIPPG